MSTDKAADRKLLEDWASNEAGASLTYEYESEVGGETLWTIRVTIEQVGEPVVVVASMARSIDIACGRTLQGLHEYGFEVGLGPQA